MKKKLAYLFSLLVLAASVWGPMAPVQAGSVCVGRGCPGLSTGGGTVTGNVLIEGTPGPNLAPAIGAGTGYTCAADWDCTVAGVLNHNNAGTGTVVPNPAITAVVGSTYEVTLTLGAVTEASTTTYTLGGTTGTEYLTTAKTYVHYVTASTTGSLVITATPATARFTITYVQVRLLAASDLEVQGQLTVRRRIEVNAGTTAAPSITGGDDDSGFGFTSGNPVNPSIISNGVASAFGAGNVLFLGGFLGSGTGYLFSPAAATWQLGLADSATPVSQTLRAQGGVGTNIGGGNLTITSGNGTGSAAGSSLIFQTPTAGGGGTGAQTMTTRLTLSQTAAVFTGTAGASFVGNVLAPAMVTTGNSTAGTMTNEVSTGYAYGRTVTHSYNWTNAVVVALGGVTAGDISVATLPAKTEVVDAQVVILTPDTSANALTVACGRTAAGYIDYIVASNAKAAANTVYGDAVGERGTNLTGFDLPSYTATTTVYCHFVKTTTNLDTVTGSTGRVILTTRLLP